MTEKNSRYSDLNNKVKIDHTAFGKDHRPKIDSIIHFYNNGLPTIGIVEDHSDNKRDYYVRDIKTGEKEKLAKFPSVICGDGCSIDTEIYQIKKQIRAIENYQSLALTALPILNAELKNKELEKLLIEKDK